MRRRRRRRRRTILLKCALTPFANLLFTCCLGRPNLCGRCIEALCGYFGQNLPSFDEFALDLLELWAFVPQIATLWFDVSRQRAEMPNLCQNEV